MKETGPMPHTEQLPPSLAENVRARLTHYWERHSPLRGDTAKVGLQEHERVIRALNKPCS